MKVEVTVDLPNRKAPELSKSELNKVLKAKRKQEKRERKEVRMQQKRDKNKAGGAFDGVSDCPESDAGPSHILGRSQWVDIDHMNRSLPLKRRSQDRILSQSDDSAANTARLNSKAPKNVHVV